MNATKRVIGILLIVISLMGMMAWERWGKSEFLYDEVLVLRKNVEKGTIITEKMLTAKKLNIDEDYLAYEDRKEIVGKQAAAFVHQGVPLFEEYFEEPKLSADEKRGTFVLALTQECILAKPETLSRGDKVFFFFGKDFVTAAYVSVTDEDGVEVIVDRKQAASLSEIINEGGKLVLAYQ